MCILTSNIGSEAAAAAAEAAAVAAAAVAGDEGFATEVAAEAEAARALLMAQVKARLSPELLNRIDEVLIFGRFAPEQMAGVVDLEIEQAAAHLRGGTSELQLQVTGRARAWLAKAGYSPVYGARPLRRLVQTELMQPLARHLLGGTVQQGGAAVVDVDKSAPPSVKGVAGALAVRAG